MKNAQATTAEAHSKDGDLDQDFLERFSEGIGWKAILLYQYISGYIVMIALSAITATAIAWLELMFVLITPDKSGDHVEVVVFFLMDFLYLVDIIFRVLYTITSWPNMKLYNEPVPIEFILIDVISLIPYDVVYTAVGTNSLVVACLRLRVTIRLYRVSTALSQLAKKSHGLSIFSTMFWSGVLLVFFLIIPSAVHYGLYCQTVTCPYWNYTNYIPACLAATRYLLTNGPDLKMYYPTDDIYHMYALFAILYSLGTMVIIGDLACKSINKLQVIYMFIHDYQKSMRLYRYFKNIYGTSWSFEDQQLCITLKDYYYNFLSQRNGISAEAVLGKILPPSITTLIITDMAYDCFRHSHLFRSIDMTIIRFLSPLVRFEFAVPGQVITRKGDFFDRMLYISHGVLQVLSHEDGETPVLNLSGGTCLGETTLFVSYASNCTIICQTYCELVVVDKNVLKKFMDFYPTEYLTLVKNVQERFSDAKRLRLVVDERMEPNMIKNDLQIMSWIKQFQRSFLHEKKDDVTLEAKIKGIQYYMDNLIFYVGYMDKLVVSEEIELVKDSVFLKSSFHFILQPHSPILLIWDISIIIMTLLFIVVYPYSLCYPSTTLNVQTVFTVFITCLYILDIYLQMFTAVKTRGAYYLNVRSILVYRLRQKEFLVDCFAALPLEYFIIFLTGQMSDVMFIFLQANRLAKYYKIVSFFDNLNVWSTNVLTVYYYLKYVMHFIIFYYYTTMITYLINCYEDVCTPEFQAMFNTLNANTGILRIMATAPLSNSIINGVVIGKMPLTKNPNIYFAYAIMAIIAYMLKIVFLINVIASSALQNYVFLKEHEYLLGIIESLDWFEVSKSYRKAVSSYLNSIFYFKLQIFEHYNEMQLPADLSVSFRNIHISRVLLANPFFTLISQDKLNTLCSFLKVEIIPANMLILNSGQTTDEFYIIQKGYCTKWYGDTSTEVTVNENLGLMEFLLGIPVFHTVITLSDCILLRVSGTDLHKYLTTYNDEAEMISNAISEFKKCHAFLFRREEGSFHELDQCKNRLIFREDESSIIVEKKSRKFKRFFTRCKDIGRGGAYFGTISTTSKLLLIWEIIKNSALLISLAFTGFSFNNRSSTTFYILLFLDMFNFADILLRFCVTYFDSRGKEVKRLTKTTVYYLSHAFLMDFAGSFPIDLITPNGKIIYTRLNRFILGYRVIGLAYYLTHSVKRVRRYVFASYIIMVLMFSLNASNYYIYTECVLKGSDITCQRNSWYSLSLNHVNTQTIHFESLLYVLSIFVGIGFNRYDNISLYQRYVLSLWGMVGHLLVVIFIGRAVSFGMFQNANLITYQEAMRDLVRFLSYCDIDKGIKFEVIQYFEYIWEKRQGKDIVDIIAQFPTSVKKDLLLNIYGKYLRQKGSIFSTASENFLKELLMIIKQETFRKTGIIYKIDDIHGHIFFLLKGQVEVVGPDTNRLVTLVSGSIFGCLDDCKETRQTLTMVARGHVETLCFSSEDFYALLNNHPVFLAEFNAIANMHFDFIPASRTSISSYNKSESQQEVKMDQIKTKLHRFATKIWKPNKYIQISELTLYIVEFFFGLFYELHLMTTHPSLLTILLAYSRDSLWLIRMYMKFHTAYEDEYGMLEFNRRNIARSYCHRRDGFYFDLFCVIPLDIFAFLVTDPIVFNNVFFALRLNRFARCYYLFRRMAIKTQKLNINVLLMRIIFILMYAYIYVLVKLILYYWTETFLAKDPQMNNRQLMDRTLIYVDTIIFMFTTSPVPFKTFFNGWAPFTLIFIICMDAGFLVLFYSNCAATLQVVTKIKSEYVRICRRLRLLMYICDASLPLIERVERYTNVLLRIRNGIQFPFLLEQAPYYLREAVLNSMFGFHLRNHYLFHGCHIDFLRQLAASMRTLVYFEGDQICEAGDIDETMYFIQEGVVQAISKDTLYTETCDHLLVAGDSFGLDQLLTPRVGQYFTYRPRVLTTLVTINRSAFVRLTQFFPSVAKHMASKECEFAS